MDRQLDLEITEVIGVLEDYDIEETELVHQSEVETRKEMRKNNKTLIF